MSIDTLPFNFPNKKEKIENSTKIWQRQKLVNKIVQNFAQKTKKNLQKLEKVHTNFQTNMKNGRLPNWLGEKLDTKLSLKKQNKWELKINEIKEIPKQIKKMEDYPKIGSMQNWTTGLPVKIARKWQIVKLD